MPPVDDQGASPRSDPRAREARVWATAAAIAGFFALSLDLVLLLVRGEGPPWEATLAAGLIFLPLLLAAAVLALLPARPVALLLTAAIAYGLGRSLALGPRAATMPLAAFWGPIAAGLAGLAALALLQLASNPGAGRRRVLGLLALAAPIVFFVAANLQRGRYQEPRFWANLLVLGALLAIGRHLAARIGPRPSSLLAIAAAILLGCGAAVALLDDPAAASAIRSSSLAETLVVEARGRLLPPLAVAPGDYRHRPVLASALGNLARARLDAAGGPPRGVLLITIDAMRADLQGRDVGGRRVAPEIDALAAGGMHFDRAYAPAPMTQFSVFATLAGWNPSQFLSYRGGFDGCPLITDSLRAAGVETRGCYPRGMLTIGGDLFQRHDLGFETSSLHPWDDLGIDETFERLRPRGEGRWFSYLHLMLPHHPYDGAADEFQAGGSDFERFAAEVRQCDAFVAALLERFASEGLDDAWVVVSADHGEEFGEHGAYRHSTQVFEESVHVPLVWSGRGVVKGSYAMPVSLIDLPPTLHQIFDLPTRDVLYAGRSLLPLLVGLDDPERPDSVLVENPPVLLNRANTRAALIGPELKLIADERSRRLLLYDLKADPGETRDLSVERSADARRLYSRLVARRRFGGEGETIFETMPDFLGLIDETARAGGVGGVLSAYEWMKGLALEDELRLLGFFVEFPDGEVLSRLRSLLADRPEPAIQAMLELIGFALDAPAPARFAAALEVARGLDSTAIDDALLAVAARYDLDCGALGAPVVGEDRLRRLSRARQRSTRPAGAGVEALVRAGLASDSPWRQSIALDVALESDLAIDSKLLRSIREEAKIPRLRLTALRLMGARGGPEVVALLLEVFRSGDLEEAAVAARGLALREVGAERMARFSCQAAPATLEGLADASPLPPYFLMGGRRASAPLPRPDGACRVALFLSFQGYPDRRLRLGVGDWNLLLEYGPVVPGDPVVVELPAGDAPRIEFEKRGEQGWSVLYAGSLAVAID